MEEMALGVGVAGAMTLLRFLGDWLIFRKAGKPGWHSIIPILHMYDEYDICWKGSKGVWAALFLIIACMANEPASDSGAMVFIPGLAAILYMILEFRESRRLKQPKSDIIRVRLLYTDYFYRIRLVGWV